MLLSILAVSGRSFVAPGAKLPVVSSITELALKTIPLDWSSLGAVGRPPAAGLAVPVSVTCAGAAASRLTLRRKGSQSRRPTGLPYPQCQERRSNPARTLSQREQVQTGWIDLGQIFGASKRKPPGGGTEGEVFPIITQSRARLMGSKPRSALTVPMRAPRALSSPAAAACPRQDLRPPCCSRPVRSRCRSARRSRP